MNLFNFLKPRGTAPVARERLQILLAHERTALGPRDLVTILRDELLATIARHIEFDPEKLSVKMERANFVLDARDRCREFPATSSSLGPTRRRPDALCRRDAESASWVKRSSGVAIR